jgi:hypothetical protein
MVFQVVACLFAIEGSPTGDGLLLISLPWMLQGLHEISAFSHLLLDGVSR